MLVEQAYPEGGDAPDQNGHGQHRANQINKMAPLSFTTPRWESRRDASLHVWTTFDRLRSIPRNGA